MFEVAASSKEYACTGSAGGCWSALKSGQWPGELFLSWPGLDDKDTIEHGALKLVSSVLWCHLHSAVYVLICLHVVVAPGYVKKLLLIFAEC